MEIIAKILLGFSEQELKWQDWSLEREQTKKRMHDNFLLEQLGPPPYQFPWGRVVSVFDSRNQEAYIKIECAYLAQTLVLGKKSIFGRLNREHNWEMTAVPSRPSLRSMKPIHHVSDGQASA